LTTTGTPEVAFPPAGQDVFLIGSVAKVDNSHLSLYSIHIDWSNPQGATITGSRDSQLIAVPTYAPACPGHQLGACAPELNGEDLETISDRLMYRFAYYIDRPAAHVGPSAGPLPQQHWYVTHAVATTGGQVAMRWYEFRAPLKKVDVSGVEATAHAFPVYNVWADDIAQPGLPVEVALKNAPAQRNNMVVVPKVVE